VALVNLKGWIKDISARPTIFNNVDNDMTIAREEIFGPVMSIITYNDVDEAIKIANDTEYGLSSHTYMVKIKTHYYKVARSD
jgi:aldehyde dehydrogenase (NAD+)